MLYEINYIIGNLLLISVKLIKNNEVIKKKKKKKK